MAPRERRKKDGEIARPANARKKKDRIHGVNNETTSRSPSIGVDPSRRREQRVRDEFLCRGSVYVCLCCVCTCVRTGSRGEARSGSSGDERLDYKRREEIRVYRKDYIYIYIYIYTEESTLGEALQKEGREKLSAGHRVRVDVCVYTSTSPTRRAREVVSPSLFFFILQDAEKLHIIQGFHDIFRERFFFLGECFIVRHLCLYHLNLELYILYIRVIYALH